MTLYMMAEKKENYTKSTIDAIQKMEQSCKVVLSKLSPALIDKYTRSHHETEYSQGNRVIEKSRKRKHIKVADCSSQESDSTTSKCVNKFTKYNFRATHKVSKKNPIAKSDKRNHIKTAISVSDENSTDLDNIHCNELSKPIRYPLNHNCFHPKRKKGSDSSLDMPTNEQTNNKNLKCSIPPHVAATVNVNFYCKDYESCEDNKERTCFSAALDKIDKNSSEKTTCNYIHTSCKTGQKSSKKHNDSKSKDKQLHTTLFRPAKTGNNSENKINNIKLNFKSLNKNVKNMGNVVFPNESMGLQDVSKFHTFNGSNESRSKHKNNNTNSSVLGSKKETSTAVTESESQICSLSIDNGIRNKSSSNITGVDCLANVDRMLLCNKERICTTSSSKEINIVSNNDINVNVNNKIGKIRVRDPQSLGIQSFRSNDSNHLVNKGTSGHSDHMRQSVENMSIEELVSNYSNHNLTENDIAVLRNYKKHFTDLTESKLPKMGMLLHLAVQDFVHRDERIQHSEKLCSPDLIKQEKLAAEVEFNGIFQTRGVEFSSLLETILNNFDRDCMEDMILALYCRVLDMFLIIDKQNKKHIVRARYVLHKMLHKINYKNNVVCKILTMKGSDFSQCLSRMSHYILIYNNVVNTSYSNTVSKTFSSLNSNNTVTQNIINENTAIFSNKVANVSIINKDSSNPVLNLHDCADTRIPVKSQHNVFGNSSTSATDQLSSLSTRLSNMSISGKMNNFILNMNSLISSSFTTNINEHVVHDHKSNIDFNRYNHQRSSELVLNTTEDVTSQYITQTDISTLQNTTNNLQYSMQAENVNTVPFAQTPGNLKIKSSNLRYINNSVNNLSVNSSTNQNSTRCFIPNKHYSHQNQSYIPSTVNGGSIKTGKIQMNRLYTQKDINAQNTMNILQQSSEVLQRTNSFVISCQKAAKYPPSQLSALPYIYTPRPELLQKILSKLNTSSVFSSVDENVKKTVEDTSKYSAEENIVSKTMQQNERLESTVNSKLKTVDGQNRNFLFQPNNNNDNNNNKLHYYSDNSYPHVNAASSHGYTQRVTMVNKNQSKMSQQEIHQVAGVQIMKSYQQTNVPNASKTATHKFVQTINVDKTHYRLTQNRLPVISQVFSCGIPTSSSHSVILPTQDSVARITVHSNNENKNNDRILASSNGLKLPNFGNVPTYVISSNYLQPLAVSSNRQQSIMESKTNYINPLTTTTNGVSYVSSQSETLLLPHDNTNGFSTSRVVNTVQNAANHNRSFHSSVPVVHNLHRSVPKINQIIPIIGGQGIKHARIKLQALTCTRRDCSQKSNKLCSVCKRVTYCSIECQTKDWYDGHLNVCRPR